MLQMICIVSFICAPLFVLITYLLTSQAAHHKSLFKDEDQPLAEEEIHRIAPAELLQHRRLGVWYSHLKKRFGSGENYVHYGNVPLTEWIKHDVPLKQGFQPGSQVLRKICLLKHYNPKKAVPMMPVLKTAAGGSR